MAAGHKEEMNSTMATVAATAAVPTTILKTSAKPIHPRTKRRPSVTFKLPIDNNDDDDDDDHDDAEEEPGTAASPTLTTNDSLTATVPTSTEAFNKKQKEQVVSLAPCVNHNEGDNNNSTIVPIDDEIKALHMGNDTKAGEAVKQAEGTVAQTLMTQPEAMSSIVLEIADVALKPFVAKQTGAQAPPVAPAFIDETHRQFSNPISYLGGPMLKTRNRHSISSILSLD